MAAATEEEESQGEESVGSTQQWCTNEVIVKAWPYLGLAIQWLALGGPCSPLLE